MTEEEIKTFEEKVTLLESWIKKHEKLPENIGNLILLNFDSFLIFF